MSALLLGHSLGTSPAVWGSVLPLLPAGVDAHAFPLPGHGAPRPVGAPSIDAAADAVVELADALGIARFHYAGVSIGGAIGLALALRHPGRLRSLSVVCAVPKFGRGEDWRDRAGQVRRQGTPVLVGSSASRWFAPGFIEREPESVGRLLHDLSDTDDEAYAWYCEALAGFDVRARLAEIEVPTLVLAGDADPVATPEAARELAETVEDGRVQVLVGCGHQAPLERPREVAAAITALMEEAGR